MIRRFVSVAAVAATLVVGAGCARSAQGIDDGPPVVPAPTPVVAAPDTAFDRTTPPVLADPAPLSLPPVTRRVLPNGLTLLVVEHRELPVADFILVVGTGAEADPSPRTGLATLTASLLDEGTTSRTALEIADQAAFLGITLASGAGWDASTVRLHTPTAVLDSALALYADVVLRPAFPGEDLERLRKERLTQLLQIRDRPPIIADLAFAAILYGEEHPYGRSPIGGEESTRAITRDEVRRFYETYYRPNNATLIVVGDVRPDEIAQRVGRAFGAWERGATPAAPIPEPAARGATTLYLIDKPAAPQSSVRIGTFGVPRATEDYFPIVVMNTILGGSFTSRLNQNLRETKGYTYGAGSFFDMRRATGPFIARAEVTGTKTDSAVIEFMKELRAIRDTVPQAELEKAKAYLQLGLPADFETTGDIAAQLVPIAVHALPLDYWNTYSQRIAAVTQADVQRVANRYVDPGSVAVVIVGDRQSIEEGLRALRIGEVMLRDLSGDPVPARSP